MKVVHSLSKLFLALLLSRVAADVCSQVSPSRHIPPNMKCDFQGSLSTQPDLGTFPIPHPATDRGQAACRNICLEDPDCSFYGLNTTSGTCSKYSPKYSLQTAQAGKTKTFFTNRYCWQQNFTTSPGLQNVGFETGGLSLRPWFRNSDNPQYMPHQTKPGANDSTYSALLSVGTSIGTHNQTIYLPFNVCPNVTYRIQPLVQFLGAANTTSVSEVSFSMSDAAAGFGNACASAAEARLAFNSTTGFTVFSEYRNGLFDITNGNQASSFAIGFTLAYDDFDNNGNPVTPPLLEQYRVDFNLRKGVSPPSFGSGVSCSASA